MDKARESVHHRAYGPVHQVDKSYYHLPHNPTTSSADGTRTLDNALRRNRRYPDRLRQLAHFEVLRCATPIFGPKNGHNNERPIRVQRESSTVNQYISRKIAPLF